MAGLEAGALDREITLQTVVETQNASGELVRDWSGATSETLWAQWLPAGTKEAWQAQQRLGSYVDGVFQIYDRETRPTPDGSQRILFDGRVFDLKPYIEIGRGEGLQIPVIARGE